MKKRRLVLAAIAACLLAGSGLLLWGFFAPIKATMEFTLEDAQRALKAMSPKQWKEAPPEWVDPALKDLNGDRVRLGDLSGAEFGKGKLNQQDRGGWTIDLEAKRFQWAGTFKRCGGEFRRHEGSWLAEVTFAWSFHISPGP